MRRIALAAVLTLSFSAPAAAQDARGGPEDQDNVVSPGAEFEPGVEPAPFAATASTQPTWETSFVPGVTDPDGNLLDATEVRQFAVFGSPPKLYAAVSGWMDQGQTKGSAKVIRLDSSGGQWRQEVDFGDLATGALVSLNWKADASGDAVNVWTLVASTWSGATTYVKNNSDGRWYKTSLDPQGQIRAFGTHKDAAANKMWGFAGGKPGVFRGQLADQRGAGKNIIDWQTGAANLELNTANLSLPLCSGGNRVTGFQEARGKLFLTVCWRVYARVDGNQGNCNPSQVNTGGNQCSPRWKQFWDDPHATQGESGLRGLTTVSISGKQYLLIGSEGPSMHITRLDPDTADSTVELDVSDYIQSHWGTSTGYGIIPYNSPASLVYNANGRGRRIFGFETWASGKPVPGHSRMILKTGGLMNGEGFFFLRNAATSYELMQIPAITPQPMLSVATPSPAHFLTSATATAEIAGSISAGSTRTSPRRKRRVTPSHARFRR